jgi:hypothetical protein
MGVEMAYTEFKKFKRKVNDGLAAYGVGLAAYLSTLFLLSENDTDDFTKKGITTVSILIVGSVTGYIIKRRFIRNLKNAVEIYNLNLE